jgi:hypothetical protein
MLLKTNVPYLYGTPKHRPLTRYAEGSTYINNENPSTCTTEIGQTSISHPRTRLMIQMVRVRHISVKLRATELTCLVMLSPKKLNMLMLHMMVTPLQRTVGVLSSWSSPRWRSKNGSAEGGSEGRIRGRMGIMRTMLSAPKKPSQPTATRGVTLYRDRIFSAYQDRPWSAYD